MSAPSPKPTLAQLMAAVGLPGLTQAERDAAAKSVSRELAARKYAAVFLDCMDPVKAYVTALRPQCKLSGRKTRERATRWFADPRVREFIREPLQRAITKAEVNVGMLAERISEQIDSSLFDFAEWDDQGNITNFKFDVANLTPAQRRCVRSVSLKRVYDKEAKEWKTFVSDIRLVDSQRAVEAAMALVALTRKLGENDETGTIPGELSKRLEKVTEEREVYLRRLPASRTRSIIEHEK